jgi:hypothetical protein
MGEEGLCEFFQVLFSVMPTLALILGCFHLVQKSQTFQGQAGLQDWKENFTPAGCGQGEGRRDQGHHHLQTS